MRTHIAPPHESLFIKFPMFIPVCPHPLSRVGITPFVLETYRDAVIGLTPQFFHQVIVQFFGPFATEKSFDRLSTRKELRPVAPVGIRGVRQRDPLRVTTIPGIPGSFDFQKSRFSGERRSE